MQHIQSGLFGKLADFGPEQWSEQQKNDAEWCQSVEAQPVVECQIDGGSDDAGGAGDVDADLGKLENLGQLPARIR